MRHYLTLIGGGVLAGFAHAFAAVMPLTVTLPVAVVLSGTVIGTAMFNDWREARHEVHRPVRQR